MRIDWPMILEKAKAAGKYAATELGPLIVFWVLTLTVSTKAAIAGTVVAIIVDGVWRWKRGVKFTKLYMVTSALTLVFGAADLWADHPFMLAYEAVVTNILTGGFFLYGAMGKKPLVQELAEQREGEDFGDRPDFVRFFRLFTLAWALYFLLKAALYLWAAITMTLEGAMALRSATGTASMLVMVAISATQGERLFRWGKRVGILPRVPEDDEPDEAEATPAEPPRTPQPPPA